jgi:hypothetical protein
MRSREGHQDNREHAVEPALGAKVGRAIDPLASPAGQQVYQHDDEREADGWEGVPGMGGDYRGLGSTNAATSSHMANRNRANASPR